MFITRVPTEERELPPEPSLLPPDVPIESPPTEMRLSKQVKKRLETSNRAAYVGLPKIITEGRPSLHSGIRDFIASLQLPGLCGVQSSGHSYYALLFNTATSRDAGTDKIKKTAFHAGDGNMKIDLTVRKFGKSKPEDATIWAIHADILTKSAAIARAVKKHVKSISKPLSVSYEIRPRLDKGVRNGNWYVRFDQKAPPFIKRLKVAGEVRRVSRVRRYECYFCGSASHNIFGCKMEDGKNSLGSLVRNAKASNVGGKARKKDDTSAEGESAERGK